MCVHVMKQKKCHYIGNCSFAHSLEERDVWTYMKNNSRKLLGPTVHFSVVEYRTLSKLNHHANQIVLNGHPRCPTLVVKGYRLFLLSLFPPPPPSAVRDMQQMYELWLQLTNQSRRSESSVVSSSPDDKQVTITADYAESMVRGYDIVIGNLHISALFMWLIDFLC